MNYGRRQALNPCSTACQDNNQKKGRGVIHGFSLGSQTNLSNRGRPQPQRAYRPLATQRKQRTCTAAGLGPAVPLPGYIDPGGEYYRFGTTESQSAEIGA